MKADAVIERSDKTRLAGYLEIDHKRGVIYFHCPEGAAGVGYPPTKLRVQGLGPIPLERGFMIDCRAEMLPDDPAPGSGWAKKESEESNHGIMSKMRG